VGKDWPLISRPLSCAPPPLLPLLLVCHALETGVPLCLETATVRQFPRVFLLLPFGPVPDIRDNEDTRPPSASLGGLYKDALREPTLFLDAVLQRIVLYPFFPLSGVLECSMTLSVETLPLVEDLCCDAAFLRILPHEVL